MNNKSNRRYLSSVEVAVLWHVLLYGPVTCDRVAHALQIPKNMVSTFMNSLTRSKRLETWEKENGKTKYGYVASYRREDSEDGCDPRCESSSTRDVLFR